VLTSLSLGCNPIKYDWCPYKKDVNTETQRGHHVLFAGKIDCCSWKPRTLGLPNTGGENWGVAGGEAFV
jgi:hypothetical protein